MQQEKDSEKEDNPLQQTRRVAEEVFHSGIYKAILSNPTRKDLPVKIVFGRLPQGYQTEKHSGNKVFHENLTFEEAQNRIVVGLEGDYRQYNAWDDEFEYSLRITKKGTPLFSKHPAASAPKPKEEHNRAKQYLLKEGTVIPPLVDMGIFTPDGRVVKAMYDKFKQINRFIEIIDDELSGWDSSKTLHVIDFGCGKSYLSFILYYYLVELKKYDVRITGLDLKADVIQHCERAAEKYGYQHLRFELGDINGYRTDQPVEMVISLHACDTATDYALYNAVSWNARYIFSVPCCQHELNRQMKSESLALLTRYGIIQERAAALMTDAVRANLLTACGYKTQLLEFVDLSHTPKNLLIRSVRAPLSAQAKKKALDEVKSLCGAFNLKPTLLDLLKDQV